MNKLWNCNTPGIDDDLFIRGKIPMTKSEVRSVSLSKLNLVKGLRVVDIGAGTGSVTIECASQGCYVTAIERNPEGVDLIHKNCKHFGLEEVEVIHGLAPEDLPKGEAFDRAFIGGSGGKLQSMFEYLNNYLIKGGILVANTITIQNTYLIMEQLTHYGYTNIEAVTLNVSRSKNVGKVHMMMAENPITIISGIKGDENE